MILLPISILAQEKYVYPFPFPFKQYFFYLLVFLFVRYYYILMFFFSKSTTRTCVGRHFANLISRLFWKVSFEIFMFSKPNRTFSTNNHLCITNISFCSKYHYYLSLKCASVGCDVYLTGARMGELFLNLEFFSKWVEVELFRESRIFY